MKLRSWLFIPLVFASCASAQDASKDRHGLSRQPQVYLTHQTANRSFKIESTGYRLGAAFVSPLWIGFAQMNESASLQQKLDLRDPVNYLKERIAETLRRELGLTNLQVQSEASDLPVLPPIDRGSGNSADAESSTSGVVQEPVAPQSPALRGFVDETPAAKNPTADEAAAPKSAARAPQSPAMRGFEDEWSAAAAKGPTFRDKHPTGAVIQVVTRHWGIDNYKMKYLASYWLIDLERAKRLRSGTCRVIFDQVEEKDLPASAPNRDDPNEVPARRAALEEAIFRDNGALLKDSLRAAAEECADWITAQLIAVRRRAIRAK